MAKTTSLSADDDDICIVTRYGATGNGTTDDTAAIQLALNDAAAVSTPGNVCYLPAGVYRTSVPLIVPPQVTLMGAHEVGLTYSTAPANPCVIRPLSGFTGRGIVRLLDKTTGGYATDSVAQRVRYLTIDGSGTSTASVVGVEVYGMVREAAFEHVTVRNTTGDGFGTTGHDTYTGDAAAPQSLRYENCYADNVTGAGFVSSGATDMVYLACNSQGSGYVGFYLGASPNAQLIGCRAEWAAQHGYYITGSYGTGQGSGSALLAGCSSDRNNFNGVFVDSTGSACHNITGFSARRDGRNGGTGGGNYAGIFVATTATTPVWITGLTVYPGVNDDGTGTNSPQIGVSSTGSNITGLHSAYVHAATTALVTGTGFNPGPGVGQATGTTAAPVRATPTVSVVTTQRGPIRAPLTVAYAATITPDASVADNFKITATGNVALAVPTNPVDTQMIVVAVLASGAARAVTLASGIQLTTGQSATITPATGKVAFIGLRYSVLSGNWTCLAMTAEQ